MTSRTIYDVTHNIWLFQVTYASLARKHGLSASAQEWLARVHTIPSVPLTDCHKKLKEQIKVHLLPPASQQDLLAALDVIEGLFLFHFHFLFVVI